MTAERPKLLFTGASGFLASNVLPWLAESFDCIGVSRSEPGDETSFLAAREQADLTDPTAVKWLLRNRPVDVVVHAAALANVDACEREPAAAYRANVAMTANLVRAMTELGGNARLVLVSTDQVYNGPGPHAEGDVAPINVYALTKLWAEDWAERYGNALTVRVNFFGFNGRDRSGLAGWVARSLAARERITLFDDVMFNPLHTAHLAEILSALIARGSLGRINLGAGGRGMSKANFARLIADKLGLSLDNAVVGKAAEAALAAARPKDMRMRTDRLEAELGRSIPTVEDGIELFCAEWLAAATAHELEASGWR